MSAAAALADLLDILPTAEVVGGTVIHGLRGDRATLGQITAGDLVLLTPTGEERYKAASKTSAAAAVAAANEPSPRSTRAAARAAARAAPDEPAAQEEPAGEPEE